MICDSKTRLLKSFAIEDPLTLNFVVPGTLLLEFCFKFTDSIAVFNVILHVEIQHRLQSEKVDLEGRVAVPLYWLQLLLAVKIGLDLRMSLSSPRNLLRVKLQGLIALEVKWI